MTKLPQIRRIVTGHSEDGKALIVENGPPPHVTRPPAQKGLAFHEIWSTDEMPMPLGLDMVDPTQTHRSTAPPRNGTIARFVDIPPEGDLEINAKDVLEAVGLGDNHAQATSARHPLMHRTKTVDYGVVISGEIVMMLDEEEVTLKPGDIVVQRGTIHAWANRSDAMCRMFFVLTDAEFTADLTSAQAAQDAQLKKHD